MDNIPNSLPGRAAFLLVLALPADLASIGFCLVLCHLMNPILFHLFPLPQPPHRKELFQ